VSWLCAKPSSRYSIAAAIPTASGSGQAGHAQLHHAVDSATFNPLPQPGLDPGVCPFVETLVVGMDERVKPRRQGLHLRG